MFKFTLVKRHLEKFHETVVSDGDGEAYQGAIDEAIEDFGKKHPDLEIYNWSVRVRLTTEPQIYDSILIIADQILSISAKKRRIIKKKTKKR